MLRPRIFRGRPSNRVITSADLAETPSFWCTQLYLKCFKILDDAPPPYSYSARGRRANQGRVIKGEGAAIGRLD